MKIRITAIILTVMLFCGLAALVSCDKDNETPTPSGTTTVAPDNTTTAGDGETTTDKPDTTTAAPSDPEITSVDAAMTLSGDTISVALPTEAKSYDFNGRIKVSTGSSWSVYTDEAALNPVPGKVASVEVGENTFYILVTAGDSKKLYTVTVTREAPPVTEPPITLPVDQFNIENSGVGDIIDFPVG